MKYDFTSVIDRKGKDALAIDALGNGGGVPGAPKDGFDALSMWVADMNFATVPSVTSAIAQRLSHPLFGYFETRKEYYDSIIAWQKNRNGVLGLTEEHIGYENGVLGGMLSAMAVFCSQGDAVLVHAPVYMGFSGSLKSAGYNMVCSPLVQDEAGVWRMDFADMEKKIVENGIHAAIFCSPHNPTGRVWERWEIEQAMEIYRKHNVYVVSDEIWSDLILFGNRHIPTQSVSEDAKNRTVALYAPSKTFNLAGLIGAYHIIYNPWLRDRVAQAASKSHYNNLNVLSMYALMGAYQPEGGEWVDELCTVLSQNAEYACKYIWEHFEGVRVSKPQGTYMIFLDCAEWLEKHQMTLDELLQAGWDVGVAWQDGRHHGGTTHIRVNLALPFDRMKEAFHRLERYVFGKNMI